MKQQFLTAIDGMRKQIAQVKAKQAILNPTQGALIAPNVPAAIVDSFNGMVQGAKSIEMDDVAIFRSVDASTRRKADQGNNYLLRLGQSNGSKVQIFSAETKAPMSRFQLGDMMYQLEPTRSGIINRKFKIALSGFRRISNLEYVTVTLCLSGLRIDKRGRNLTSYTNALRETWKVEPDGTRRMTEVVYLGGGKSEIEWQLPSTIRRGSAVSNPKFAHLVLPQVSVAQANKGFTAAMNQSDYQKLRKWILAGATNVNEKSKGGPSVETALFWAIRENDMDCFTLLLQRGADVNAQDMARDGITPLSEAAGKNAVSMVRLLLEKGANINARYGYGFTPLYAAWTNIDVVRLLLEKGADVNAKNNDGRTMLYMLTPATTPESLAVVSLLLNHGADINAVDKYGCTALHCAAWSNSPEFIKFLLDKGADINLKDKDGKTPLQLAVERGKAENAAIIWSKGKKD